MNQRLLFVDDETLIRNGMKQVINWPNYGIDFFATASSGEEALEIINSNEISIMITDVRMPGITGISLIENALKIQPHLKCIVLSGYSDYELIRAAMRKGAVDYLLKPIVTEELIDSIEGIVSQLEPNEDSNKILTEQHLLDNTMRRIIHNSIAFKEKRERLEYFGLNQNYKCVYLSLIRTSLSYDYIYDRLHKKFSVFEGTILTFNDGLGNICSLLLLEKQEDNETIKNVLSSIIDDILKAPSDFIYVVLGSCKNSLRQLSPLYSQCSWNLDFAIFHGQNQVNICENEIPESSLDLNYSRTWRCEQKYNQNDAIQHFEADFLRS